MLVVALAAKAGLRAHEVTGCRRTTVKSILTRGDDWLDGVSCLVIEEASMVGSIEMAELLEAALRNHVRKIVLCGDPDQLSPINNGAPFVDLIRSGKAPVFRLTENPDRSRIARDCGVLRGNSGRRSGVIDLNQMIDWGSIDFSQVMAEDRGDNERNLDVLLKTRAGVQFVPVVEDDEIVDGYASPPRPATIKTVVKAYQELVAIHGPENVITICPFKDKPAGVRELNNAIRASLGASSLIKSNAARAASSRRARSASIAPVGVLGSSLVAADIYAWLVFAGVILLGSQLIWWATEHAWGKYS